MLQYIIKSNNAISLKDNVKCALEGGCKWIRLDVSLMESDDTEQCVKDILAMCKKHDCILTIEDDVEIAKQTQVDGVHLTKIASISPVEARKQLGEEPILGMTISEANEVPFLPRTAVDYIEVSDCNEIQEYTKIVAQMKQTGLEEPVVARLNDITAVNEVMAAGINGIALMHNLSHMGILNDLISQLENIVEKHLQELD